MQSFTLPAVTKLAVRWFSRITEAVHTDLCNNRIKQSSKSYSIEEQLVVMSTKGLKVLQISKMDNCLSGDYCLDGVYVGWY